MAENNVIKYDEAVRKLTEDFRKQISAVSDTVEVYNKLHTSMSNLPSNVVNQINAINTANEKLTKTNNDLVISSQKAEKAEKTRVQQILTTGASLEKQKTREIALEEKSQALLTKSENLYNKIQEKVNQTSQAYNNLAAKKEIGLTLTDKEQRSLALLEARMTKYSGVLKTVDANVGKYNRNVGNYASGWNGLSHNINQITREMPAFAVSMNTGFLALSNNIPMLFDEIKKTKDGIAQLRAEGKPTESLFTKLASSLFSWQTALSLGVTLLTIYGKEIVEFIANATKGAKQIDVLKMSQESLNKAFSDTSVVKVSSQIKEMQQNIQLAKDGIIDKTRVLKAYNEGLGQVTGQAKNLDEAERLLTQNADAYIKTTLYKAAANLALEEAAKKALEAEQSRLKRLEEFENKFLDASVSNVRSESQYRANQANIDRQRLKRKQEEIKLLEKESKAQENIADTFIKKAKEAGKSLNMSNLILGTPTKDKKDKGKTPEELAKEAMRYSYDQQKSLLELEMARAKDLEDMETYFAKKRELDILDSDYNSELANLEIKNKENRKNKLLEIENVLKKKIIELNKEEEEEDKKIKERKDKAVSDRIKREQELYNKLLEITKKARLDQSAIVDLEIQLEIEGQKVNGTTLFNLRKEQLENWYKTQLDLTEKDSAERLKVQAEYNLKSAELENDRKKTFEESLKSTISSTFGEFGAGSLSQFFNGEFEAIWSGADSTAEKLAATMMAIQAVTADAFNAMKASSDAYFENQFNQLEKEYDVAIKYAGDSEEAKRALDEQYAERKLQLRRQQAKEEKNMAIFSAVINIATGITASLAQGGPVGIVLAALIGALGAVQIASIASQPLPAFWKGTENAPEGWALTQEKGAEVITDRQGNVKTMGDNKGAQLTYLSKGDKVYKNRDDFFKSLNSDMSSTNVVAMSNDFDYQQIDSIFGKHIQSIQPHSINFDERGMKVFIGSERNRTELLNKRINFKKR